MCCVLCAWSTDVDRSTLDQGALVPCDDVTITCHRPTGRDVFKACDVTGSTCVCSRSFVLHGDLCVGWYSVVLIYRLSVTCLGFTLH